MPKPKIVKIAGVELKEVLGVTLTVQTPSGVRGDYAGRTVAPTIQLNRRATNSPTSEMFKNATNEDGHLNVISGSITLENARKKETYTMEIKKAYISKWEFQQPPDGDLIEMITLKVGEMVLSGGGKSKSFKMPEDIWNSK